MKLLNMIWAFLCWSVRPIPPCKDCGYIHSGTCEEFEDSWDF